jgi:hypothetical protein
MIAKFFHAWERRLASVTKDRVVRPFEWGLDWIEANGHAREAPPERILLDWASRALADSQQFFTSPDTSDYQFTPQTRGATGELSFPSPLRTPHPENNTAYALYFRSVHATKGRRAVIVLPQ